MNHIRLWAWCAAAAWGTCIGFASTSSLAAEMSPIEKAECEMGTHEDAQFHIVAHYPSEHRLDFPGLIVGIEKSKADLVIRGARAQSLIEKGEKGIRADDWLESKLRGESKAMFISHVAQHKPGHKASLLYSAYSGADRDHSSSTASALGPTSIATAKA